MSFEADFRAMLMTATGRAVYWDTTPENFVLGNDQEILILQQTGGKAEFFVEKTSVPDHKHARIQVTTMGRSRLEVSALARQVQDIVAQSAYIAEPYGAPIAGMEPNFKIFTASQQFGMWFADP